MNNLALQELKRKQDISVFVTAYRSQPEVQNFATSPERRLEYPTSPEQEAAYQENPEISLPFLAITQSPIFDVQFIDPKAGGKSVDLKTYFHQWEAFFPVALHDDGKVAPPLLREALGCSPYPKDRQTLQASIDSLWEHHWICNVRECADLRIGALATSQEQLLQIMQDGTEAERAFHEFTERLTQVKETVQTLDEWFEAPYNLLPPLFYSSILLKASQSSDLQKMDRFLDEAEADIFGVLLDSFVIGVLLDFPYYWSYQYLLGSLEKNQEHDMRLLRRTLSYEYNARVTYPKFWLDKALTALIAPEETNLPSELDNFTHSRLTSLIITSQPQYAFDLYWAYSQLKEKMESEVTSFELLKELALKLKIKATRRRNPQLRIKGLPDDFFA